MMMGKSPAVFVDSQVWSMKANGHPLIVERRQRANQHSGRLSIRRDFKFTSYQLDNI